MNNKRKADGTKAYTIEEAFSHIWTKEQQEEYRKLEPELTKQLLEEIRQESMEETGKMIKRARQEAGVSQAELAAYLNTDRANISRMENGRENVSMAKLRRIAVVLGKEVKIEIV